MTSRVRAKSRYLRSRTFLIGLGLTGAVLLVALVSLFYTPYDPNKMDIPSRFQGPSGAHPFGTDRYGRDILSRVMRGAANSITVGLIAVSIGMGLGVSLGMLAGYYGSWLDEAVMRLMDAIYGFPAVLLAILITSVLDPGIKNSMIAIGISYVPLFARLTRGNFLSLREREFVLAARATGRGGPSIAWRHILPNTIPVLIVQATIGFAIAILAEAGLSYLGLGTQPPAPSWGRMLKEAQGLIRLSPWPAVFPGLAIMVAVLGFNLLGDGLRDILDPRMKLWNRETGA
ncbi:MAG: ABC transporter permease [Candidatus Bipolaricaulia bacterium]